LNNGKINPKNGKAIGQRFGYEKPAIPGPGRPRLTEKEKDARIILKEASIFAAERLQEITHSDDERNASRAAEIILSHTVPKLEEVNMHDTRPLAGVPENVVTELLDEAVSRTTPGPSQNGHSGNGATA
jgi:hypothetical protein